MSIFNNNIFVDYIESVLLCVATLHKGVYVVCVMCNVCLRDSGSQVMLGAGGGAV